MQRRILLPFCLALLAGSLSAQDKTERTWTGLNGKSFQGKFQSLSEDKYSAEFLSPGGKVLRVVLNKLVAADRKLVLSLAANPDGAPAPDGGKASPAPATPEGFKEIPAPPRKMEPLLDPMDHGGKSGGPLVDALWTGILWWESSKVLAVPGRGDLEKKANWLHKRLTDLVEKGGGDPNAEDVKRATEEYFAAELKEVATCQVTIDNEDLSAGHLSRIANGVNVVVMRMGMTYENGRDYGVNMVLEEMTPEGKFTVVLRGVRLTGLVKPVSKDKSNVPGFLESEYVFDNPSLLPELYKKNGAKFFTRPQTFNASILIRPFLYAEAGKPVPVPAGGTSVADDSPWAEPETPQGERVLAPKFPMAFKSPVLGLREWKTKTGSGFRATIAAVGADQVSLKNSEGRTVSVPLRQLADEDAACVALWQACQGQPRAFPRLRLVYHLKCPATEAEFVISSEGTLFRVEEVREQGQNSMVFDTGNGAYFSEMRHHGSDGKLTERLSLGRFEPEKLLPRAIESRHTQAEIDFFANSILPSASESTSSPVPCRKVRFPLSVHGVSFRHPEIDFVMYDSPGVLAALYHILCGGTAGARARTYAYSIGQVYSNSDDEDLFPMLAACKMLPLGMTWKNKPNARQQSEYHRERAAGDYTLTLKEATIPAAFPTGHFTIPPAANTMKLGTQDKKETVTPK